MHFRVTKAQNIRLWCPSCLFTLSFFPFAQRFLFLYHLEVKYRFKLSKPISRVKMKPNKFPSPEMTTNNICLFTNGIFQLQTLIARLLRRNFSSVNYVIHPIWSIARYANEPMMMMFAVLRLRFISLLLSIRLGCLYSATQLYVMINSRAATTATSIVPSLNKMVIYRFDVRISMFKSKIQCAICRQLDRNPAQIHWKLQTHTNNIISYLTFHFIDWDKRFQYFEFIMVCVPPIHQSVRFWVCVFFICLFVCLNSFCFVLFGIISDVVELLKLEWIEMLQKNKNESK